jgi:hypothetical protein
LAAITVGVAWGAVWWFSQPASTRPKKKLGPRDRLREKAKTSLRRDDQRDPRSRHARLSPRDTSRDRAQPSSLVAEVTAHVPALVHEAVLRSG